MKRGVDDKGGSVIGVGKFGTNILNTFSQLETEGRCKLVAI